MRLAIFSLLALLSVNTLTGATVTLDYPSPVVSQGFHAGPVQLTVNGTQYTGFSFDWADGVTVAAGDTWEANVIVIDAIPPSGNPASLYVDRLDYRAVVFLATRYPFYSQVDRWGDIQTASWNILNVDAPDTAGTGTEEFVNFATGWAPSPNIDSLVAGWVALEDVGGAGRSYLVHAPELGTQTPEPASVAITLLGLGFIAFKSARRRPRA